MMKKVIFTLAIACLSVVAVHAEDCYECDQVFSRNVCVTNTLNDDSHTECTQVDGGLDLCNMSGSECSTGDTETSGGGGGRGGILGFLNDFFGGGDSCVGDAGGCSAECRTCNWN
jgi:hypothetical protein